MLAAGCNIYAQIFRFGGGGDCIERTVMFPEPTDATNAMLDAIRPEVPALFLPGTRYRKTGVVFFGLEKVGTARQMDLFAPPKVSKASPLYKAIDAINARYGKGKVFSARHSLTLGVFASPRVANPRKGRLRRGHRREVVEDEAVETLQTRLDPLGRADGGSIKS